LRDNENMIKQLKKSKAEFITPAQGVTMAKKINAMKYVECSALHDIGITEVFFQAALIAIADKKKKTGAL
ncbi:unnamed protein product, partial [Didymodactylos carnosus]